MSNASGKHAVIHEREESILPKPDAESFAGVNVSGHLFDASVDSNPGDHWRVFLGLNFVVEAYTMSQQIVRLRTGLQNLMSPCTVTSFAALCVPPMVPKKLPQQILGQILNGQREFETTEEADSFVRVLTTMEYIQEQITPKLPIDWTNVLLVRDELLKMFDQRRNVEDPVQNRCWFVRLTVHNFFRGVRPDGSIIETLNY